MKVTNCTSTVTCMSHDLPSHDVTNRSHDMQSHASHMTHLWPPVVPLANGAKPLLSCRVPYLKSHSVAVNCHSLYSEINSYGNWNNTTVLYIKCYTLKLWYMEHDATSNTLQLQLTMHDCAVPQSCKYVHHSLNFTRWSAVCLRTTAPTTRKQLIKTIGSKCPALD